VVKAEVSQIIRMNIACYEAMLMRDLNDEKSLVDHMAAR
jgi:hypothetical protein